MEIKIKSKAMVLKAYDIPALKSKIQSNYRGAHFSFSSSYGNSLMSDDHVYVYSIEKHRPKIKQGEKSSKVLQSGFAKAYIHRIPKTLLEGAELKVKQNTRTWEFV
jgi:hypothetical protein